MWQLQATLRRSGEGSRSASAPATLTKVEDIREIMAFRILATPALVINGEVKSAGRIPNAAEISTWLATATMKQ